MFLIFEKWSVAEVGVGLLLIFGRVALLTDWS